MHAEVWERLDSFTHDVIFRAFSSVFHHHQWATEGRCGLIFIFASLILSLRWGTDRMTVLKDQSDRWALSLTLQWLHVAPYHDPNVPVRRASDPLSPRLTMLWATPLFSVPQTCPMPLWFGAKATLPSPLCLLVNLLISTNLQFSA